MHADLSDRASFEMAAAEADATRGAKVIDAATREFEVVQYSTYSYFIKVI